MDLTFGKEELAFQREVREWLKENLTPEMQGELKVSRNAYLPKEKLIDWQKRLAKKGWLCTGWPKEFGGPGFTTTQKYIFEMELAKAGAPTTSPFGPKMCAPVIMKYGSPEQKATHLPPMLNSDLIWCQGYSEPGSGSDLASLRTKAVREGDDYVVNGQKTWTTLAQHADWIFCLVRTDPQAKKQEGISFLLIDMKTPGITVRPIVTIEGGHEVNEVFFDDVKVPAENLVGQENKGWDYAKYLLGRERTGIARVGLSKERIRRIKELAALERADERPLIEDERFRAKIAAVEVELKALEMTQLRVVAAERRRTDNKPDPASSILKIKGSEIQQTISELLLEVVGPYALPYQPEYLDEERWNEPPVGPDWAPSLAPTYFNMRKVSIYGGTNEIQKNIIAKAILGL